MADVDAGGRKPEHSPLENFINSLFPLGQLMATPAALRILNDFGIEPLSLALLHGRGDWGDVSPDDRQQNEAALRDGSRIFSAYTLTRTVNGRVEVERVWCITEASPECTTFLLPCEY